MPVLNAARNMLINNASHAYISCCLYITGVASVIFTVMHAVTPNAPVHRLLPYEDE